jgi:predicted ATPase
LHWADEVTWEFVFYAARRINTLPLLLLVTFRPEDIAVHQPWAHRLAGLRGEPDVLDIPLAPLSPTDTKSIIRAVADHALPEVLIDHIAKRSEGIPLLAEELAVMQLDAPGARVPIPDIVVLLCVSERSDLIRTCGACCSSPPHQTPTR